MYGYIFQDIAIWKIRDKKNKCNMLINRSRIDNENLPGGRINKQQNLQVKVFPKISNFHWFHDGYLPGASLPDHIPD